MRLKLKIQQKIQIYIISATLIIYIISLGFISVNAKKAAYNDAIRATNIYALKSASDIQDKFNSDMSIAITLSDAFQIYDQYDKDQWQQLIKKMYKHVFATNPQIYGLWDAWELKAIDSTYTKSYGRITNSFWREGDVVKNFTELRSLNGDSELYKITKSKRAPFVSEPYFDLLVEGKKESLLMITFDAPIIKNNEFKAVIGIDITLEQIQKILNEIHPYENSYAFIISNEGHIAGHPDSDLLNKKIEDIFPEDEKKFNLSDKIKEGKAFSYITKNELGEDVYFSYVPIIVKKTTTTWTIAIAVPIKSMMQIASHNFLISAFVGLIGIILMILLIYFIGKNISKPIIRITNLLKQLATGNVKRSDKIKMSTGDEFEEMANSVNMLIEGLSKTTEFAKTIGEGNLQAEYKKLGEDDMLGSALIEMRESLIKAKEEEEKRKLEEEKQNWATQGLAKFSEILRQNNQDIKKLSVNIVKNIVDYSGAIQGGIFIIHENEDDDIEDVYYELTGSIAYNREKNMDAKFKVGEGLIGRCAYEKLTVYMEDVPENYVHITSGLGEANPRSILIVPAILDDKVYAIIELVSFDKFEDYKIKFIEKVGESIASTIANAKINEQTSRLLEQSKSQAEELAAQEEEMRQNLEELQATQEEVARLRKEEEDNNKKMIEKVERYQTALSKILDYIPVKVFLKDSQGKILIVNKKVLEVHNETRENLIGKTDFELVQDYNEAKKDWDTEQEIIKSGQPLNFVEVENINDSKTVLNTTKYPFYIDYLEEVGILGIQIDITDNVKKDEIIKHLNEEIAKLKEKYNNGTL
jgi:methyl-accepting chemotaxis protein